MKRGKVKNVIGVDLGGTHIRVGLIKGRKVVKYLKVKTPKSRSEILKNIVDMVSSVMTKKISGVGVASPGPLKNGVIKNTPNLPLKNFNLQKYLHDKLKKKVVVENDARCVALSELVYGVKKKNFIVLTLGTGVGGGIIVDGKQIGRAHV